MDKGDWTPDQARSYVAAMEGNVKRDHRRWARQIAEDLGALPAGATVLDLASGPAFLLLELAPYVPGARLVACDSSPVMLDLAVERARARGRTLQTLPSAAEATGLPDASVDVVLCKHYLRLSTAPDALLKETLRVLKPGGRAWYVDFNREAPRWKARVLQAWIWVANSRDLARDFWPTLDLALPASSLPGRFRGAGFSEARLLHAGLSYLVRGTR